MLDATYTNTNLIITIMLVRLVVGEDVISIISAYEPQVGLDKEIKHELWDNLGDLDAIPSDKKFFVGGDFNGHIDKEAVNYNSVYGEFGYGVRNESGEILLEFALAKKDEHLISYKKDDPN